MASTKRIFKVITSTEERFVTPINDSDLVYSYKKPSGIALNYKKELKTKLIFTNDSKTNRDDFDFFYSYESNISTRCEDIVCEIYKVCNGVKALEFTGIIPLTSGDWDLDKCKVTLKLESYNDTYDCIEDNKKDTTIPIAYACGITGSDLDTTQSTPFYLYETDGSDTYHLIINNFEIGLWNYFPKTITSNTSFAQAPYCLFAYLCHLIVGELLVKCGREVGEEMIRSDYFDWNAKGDTPGYIPCAMTKLNTNLPSSSYPTGTYNDRFIFLPTEAGINYVTGQTNKLTHLLVMPKSNANDETASDWEAIYGSGGAPNENKVAFEDIENIWATMFNAYWFIDTDGCMRVEHISWFNNNSSIYNSTANPHSDFNIAKRKYSYKRELAPRKEIFKFSANRDNLNGRVETSLDNKYNEIFYDSICVKGNNDKKEYTLSKITTDYLALNSKNSGLGDYYDNNGLMLFTCEFDVRFNERLHISNPYYVAQINCENIPETLLLSTSPTTYYNGHLQWANLIRRYLRDKRVLNKGINGNDTIMFTERTVKTKVQKDIILKHCCEDNFNPNQALIITDLGIGDIEEAEYNTKTEIIKITALHD